MSNATNSLGGRSIALIGIMGVGKTTIGRRLAKQLQLDFFDSDEEIEKASGRTVNGYFKDHGEAAFRVGEQKVITRLLEQDPIVLATGGGAFIQGKTRKVIQSGAITIWLKADLKTVLSRVARKNTRPLLNVPNQKAVLKDLIDARYPIYGEADITVDAGRGSHQSTLNAVTKSLRQYLNVKD